MAGKKKRSKSKRRQRGPPPPETVFIKPKQETSILVETEYVSEENSDIDVEQFGEVLSKFMKVEQLVKKPKSRGAEGAHAEEGEEETGSAAHEASAKEPSSGQAEEEEKKPLSKKKKKLANRFSVAQLKQLVKRPDVVEIHDCNASDPCLLVYLKSYRNTVPVPPHWSQKRKYLQNKRGLEKSAYKLPDYIESTGIATVRDAVRERDEQKRLKAKTRERMRPKMGKMDVDYKTLHDAFFKYQTKPAMSIHGDLYYEGREYEVKYKDFRPGRITDGLKTALGMPPGSPPPWLIQMQRYGPPPSYPNLKIPGLNAPLPQDAQYGAGGWGKPPVDKFNVPIYGDPYGIQLDEDGPPPDRRHWGELEDDDVSSIEDDDEAIEGAEMEVDDEDMPAPAPKVPTAVPKEAAPTAAEVAMGTASVPPGMETPAVIDLRKRRAGMETDDPTERRLYAVLEEKEVSATGTFGSSTRYVVNPPSQGPAGTTLTLDPTEVASLNEETIRQRYEQQLRADTGALSGAASGMASGLASGATTAERKRKAKEGGKTKKYKDFKF
eukprot:gnl/Trimastix_PCT/847.p1 GENE.gnl/Trimastix_PCT/847~~gnl/Trimastix_PCT/847.p1  ORF type:complete len:561 (-),score=152.24 gnl/Trimastix_PCT/847:28-1677(-)